MLFSLWQLCYGEATKLPNAITHPDYDAMTTDWAKFRFTYEGGHAFVEEYLERFSAREDNADFVGRQKISYSPSHAKAAIIDIKNAIYQRMIDITREDGSDSYRKSVVGEIGGVDLQSNTMTSFIGTEVLPELLAMGKVGVFIDKSEVKKGASRADTRDIHPYLYTYRIEDIRSWAVDRSGNFTAVLLRDHQDVACEDYGLVCEQAEEYRLLRFTEQGKVEVKFYDDIGAEITDRATILEIPIIPFVVFDIGQSLLTDVADYQIALLNMASSDINYTLKANFPFYTEQFNPNSEMMYSRVAEPKTTDELAGEAAPTQKASSKGIKVGTTQGRRYPKGIERPGFIHPSSEPLIASMEKQEKLKQEIRQLVNLAITNIAPTRASAESKSMDESGLEAGLSYIGLELEHGEREVGIIWSAYEGSKDVPTVKYPARYNLRSDADRRNEAKELKDLMESVPSLTYQKELAKDIATVVVGHRSSNEDLEKMYSEINDAEVIVTDSETIRSDHEAGFISTELASKVRGYPQGEVEQAKKDHAERAARIAAAQSKVTSDLGARGVDDLSNDDDAGKKEKKDGKA